MSVKNYRPIILDAAELAGLAGQLDLRGGHDFRATFATWLELDGIPTRVSMS